MKKDKLINFDREIKNAQITYSNYGKIYSMTFTGILLVISSILIYYVRKYNVFFFSPKFLHISLSIIAVISVILTLVIVGFPFIFWNIIKIINIKNKSLEKTEDIYDFQNQLRNRETYSYFDESVLDYFYENFYPVDYKKEFENVFNNYYKNDEEKFKKWLNSGEIKPKELYIKLLSNKELQKDINKNLLKLSIETTNKNIQKQISDEKKRKKEEEFKENIKSEINNYFKQ